MSSRLNLKSCTHLLYISHLPNPISGQGVLMPPHLQSSYLVVDTDTSVADVLESTDCIGIEATSNKEPPPSLESH
jgi:hypothetical protein